MTLKLVSAQEFLCGCLDFFISGDSICLNTPKVSTILGEGHFEDPEDRDCVIFPNITVKLGRFRIDSIATGTKMPRMPMNSLRSFRCILPPIELQSKFVAIAEQADKSKFMRSKSQFIEMFGDGNWPQKCLGEVGSFKRGGGQKSDYVEHGIPCIHYGQIHTKFGPFITCHITEISSDLEPKMKYASKGDLIIAITSEDVEGSCKCTAWLGDYPVAVGGHAAIYSHSMNPLYMSFFFRSVLFNHAKIEYVHGTKVFEIKPDDIAKKSVPYPPMSMQEEFSVIAQQADKSKYAYRQMHRYSDVVRIFISVF